MNHENVVSLENCDRCGSRSMEILSTHSYCIECNYFPDEEAVVAPAIPKWALDFEKKKKSVGLESMIPDQKSQRFDEAV
jgi:hypothetical protein